MTESNDQSHGNSDASKATLPGLPDEPASESAPNSHEATDPAQAGFGDVTEDGLDDETRGHVAKETSLGDHGVDVEEAERPTRLEQESASEFGVDDRSDAGDPSTDSSDDGNQAELFVTDDDQQLTLTGEQAQNQCPFETD